MTGAIATGREPSGLGLSVVQARVGIVEASQTVTEVVRFLPRTGVVGIHPATHPSRIAITAVSECL